MSSGLLPRNSSAVSSDFTNITCSNITVNSTAIVRNLIASNLSFTNISATNATISNLATIGALKVTIAPSTSSSISALTRETDGTITVSNNLVGLSGTQTITGVKTFNTGTTRFNAVNVGGSDPVSGDPMQGTFSLFNTSLQSTTILCGSSLSSNRTLTTPNASGTIALTSDLANYVDLTTNQTVAGLKTFGPFLDVRFTNPGIIDDKITYGSTNLIYQDLLNGTGSRTLQLNTNLSGFPRTVQFPDANLTVVGTDTSQALTNKTINSGSNSILITSGPLVSQNINSLIDQDVRQLSNPIFSTVQIGPIPSIQDVTIDKTDAGSCAIHVEGGGQYTFKDGVYDIVGTNIQQTLSNKNLVDSSTRIVDVGDNTRVLSFDIIGTTGTGTILQTVQTANRTITLPDASTTLVGDNNTATLSNKSLVDVLTRIVDQTDPTKYFYVDVGGSPGTFTAIVTGQTGNRFLLTPDITGTIIVDVGNQTLQNKTIANLVATGTQQSLLSNKKVSGYFSVSTTGATSATIQNIALVFSGTTLTINVEANALCTAISAGTDLNKIRGFSATFVAKNIGGTITTYTIVNSVAGDAAYAPTISLVASVAAVTLTFTGVANDTITCAGNWTINWS